MKDRQWLAGPVKAVLQQARFENGSHPFLTAYQVFELLEESVRDELLDKAKHPGGRGAGTVETAVGYLSEVLGNDFDHHEEVAFGQLDARNVKFVLDGKIVDPGNTRKITLYKWRDPEDR